MLTLTAASVLVATYVWDIERRDPNDWSSSLLLECLRNVPIAEEGFQMRSGPKSGFSVYIDWDREGNIARLAMGAFNLGFSGNSDKDWILIQGQTIKQRFETFPSGVPGAGDIRIWDSEGASGFCWRIDDIALTLSIDYMFTGGPRDRVYHTEMRESDTVWREGAIRAVMGGLLSLESEADSAVKVGGSNVRARRSAKGGRCLSVFDWAMAKGARLEIDHRLGAANILGLGKSVKLALGSDTINIDGAEQKGSGPTFHVAGEWFVDETLLGRL